MGNCCTGAGQNNVVTYLIERGCDVNAVNLLGDTALHRAVWRSQLSTVRILLENDVDPSIVNRQGHRVSDFILPFANYAYLFDKLCSFTLGN